MPKQLDLTTGLDLAGLALVAGGTGAGLWQWVGAFGLVPAGILLISGSYAAARASKRA